MCISCPRRSEELQIVMCYYGGLGIEPTYSSRATSTLNCCNSPGPTPNALIVFCLFVWTFLLLLKQTKSGLWNVTNCILSLGL